MSNHTPGPWTADDYHQGNFAVNSEQATICTFAETGWQIRAQEEANAKLIAAAPEMYDFIKSLITEYRCRCPDYYVKRGLHHPTECTGDISDEASAILEKLK